MVFTDKVAHKQDEQSDDTLLFVARWSRSGQTAAAIPVTAVKSALVVVVGAFEEAELVLDELPHDLGVVDAGYFKGVRADELGHELEGGEIGWSVDNVSRGGR